MDDNQEMLSEMLLNDSKVPYSMIDNIYHLCKDSLKSYKHLSALDIVTVIFHITGEIEKKQIGYADLPAMLKEINCLVFELASRQFKPS